MSRRWLARELAKNDKSLIGFWPLQDNMLDYSGNARHGDMYVGHPSNVSTASRVPAYKYYRDNRKGYDFGTYYNDNYIYVGNISDYNFHTYDSFSLSFWFWATTAGYCSALGKIYSPPGATAGVTGYSVDVNLVSQGSPPTLAMDLIFGMYYNYTQYFMNSTVRLDTIEKWYHVVITYNGSGMSSGVKMYINGKPRDVSSSVDALSGQDVYNNNAPFTIGAGVGANNIGANSKSGISCVRVYKRILSATESNRIYYSEKNMYRPRKAYKKVNLTNTIPLFISGPVQKTNSIPLFVSGPHPTGNQIPLFIKGAGPINNSIPLYIHGLGNITNSGNPLPLFIKGTNAWISSLNLFVKAPQPIPYGTAPTVPLSIYGTPSGVHALTKGMPLIMHATGVTAPLNLFLAGAKVGTRLTNMNMFIRGSPRYTTNTTTLFVQNTGKAATKSMPLNVNGSAWWTGGGLTPPLTGHPYNGSLNLFIKRWPSNVATLFVACGTPQQSGIPLFIRGSVIVTQQTTLALPKVLGTYTAPTTPLFISGY